MKNKKNIIIYLLIIIFMASCQNSDEDKLVEFRRIAGEKYVNWMDSYNYFEGLSDEDKKLLGSRMSNDDKAVIYFGDVKTGKIKNPPKW